MAGNGRITMAVMKSIPFIPTYMISPLSILFGGAPLLSLLAFHSTPWIYPLSSILLPTADPTLPTRHPRKHVSHFPV